MAKRKQRTIAVLARKGGVGKTTIATAIASLLAKSHETVLVDMDPQGSAAIGLGCDISSGAAELLSGKTIDIPRIDGLKLDVLAGNARLIDLPMVRAQKLTHLPHKHIVLDCYSGPQLPSLLRAVKPDVALVVTTPDPLSATMVAGAVGLAKEHTKRCAIVANRLHPAQVANFLAELGEEFDLPTFAVRTDTATIIKSQLKQMPLTSFNDSKAIADLKGVIRWL